MWTFLQWIDSFVLKISSFLRVPCIKWFIHFSKAVHIQRHDTRGKRHLLFFSQMYLFSFFFFLYVSVLQSITVKFLLKIISCYFHIFWCDRGHFKEEEIPKEKLFPFAAMSHFLKQSLGKETLDLCPKYFLVI